MSPAGPAAEANASRNALRRRGRRARWAPAREALWATLDGLLADGARVAIVGAGNGDDLPLGPIAARASAVTLLDIDQGTADRARGRVRRGLRRRIRTVAHDVTDGAADRIIGAATAPPGSPPVGRTDASPGDPGRRPSDAPRPATVPQPGVPVRPAAPPLPGAPYDVVIGDLLYSQLLYPALLDAEVPPARRRVILGAEGAALTAAVVATLHASAPVVVHVHDLACWGNGYDQPVELEEILDASGPDGLALAAGAKGPREADPRTALRTLGLPTLATALWRWPFTEGVDYLVVATVAGEAVPAAG